MGSFIPRTKKVKELIINIRSVLDHTIVENELYETYIDVKDLHLSNCYVLEVFNSDGGTWIHPSYVSLTGNGHIEHVCFIGIAYSNELYTKIRILPF